MNLEEELRGALRREPAPAGLAKRVQARVAREEDSSKAGRRTGALALAAGLAAAAITLTAVHEQRRRQYAIEARDQLITALSITQTQIRQTTRMIERNARH